MLLITFCDRLHSVQVLLLPRCSSALEIVRTLGPDHGRGLYAGVSPRARVRDDCGRAAVASASGMTAVAASPAAPPVGPEWETVSARRGLSDLSAIALVDAGEGVVATRTRAGVGGGFVENVRELVAIARTSARVFERAGR